MERYKYEGQGHKFFYSQMLNYGDFHLFINSFWFGLILSVSEKATYQHNIKKPNLKGKTYLNVKVKFKVTEHKNST